MAVKLLDVTEYAYIQDGSWIETVPKTHTRTQFVSGLVNQRKRYTRQYATIAVNLLMTRANWEKFRIALQNRGEQFTPWHDPFHDEPIHCRITSEVVSTPIEMNPKQYEFKVSFTLEHLL